MHNEELKENEYAATEIESLKESAESLKKDPSLTKTNDFIDKVTALNKKAKTSGMDEMAVTQMRKDICGIARGVMVFLFDQQGQNDYSYKIATMLKENFGDINAAVSEETKNRTRKIHIKPVLSVIGTVALVIAASILNRCEPEKSSNTFMYQYTEEDEAAVQRAMDMLDMTREGNPVEAPFSEELLENDKTYADILAIVPDICYYTIPEDSFYAFTCRCLTTANENIWVYMSAEDYINNFDSGISLNINEEPNYEMYVLPEPKRIRGKIEEVEIEDIDATRIIEFESLDPIPAE